MGNRSQLQGTPWHEEQMHKSCRDGSKYCVYNNNKFCACKPCSNFNDYCVGKGNCDWFEPKTGTPKTVSQKTVIIKQNPHNSKQLTKDMLSQPSLVTKHYKTFINSQADKSREEEIVMQQTNETEVKTKETAEEKFLRLSQSRVNNIIDDIRLLGKLSNTATYTYTDEQVEKMFSYIESVLRDTKDSFKKKKAVQEFKW